MQFRLVVAAVVAGTALSSCATLHKLTHRYEGKPIDAAISKLGPPSSVYELGSGAKVYSFSQGYSSRATAGENVFSQQKHVDVATQECVLQLTADYYGVVIEQQKRGCD